MVDSPKAEPEAEHEAVDSLIGIGAEIAGGITGAALGFFAAGPAGAIAVGAIGPVVTHSFRLVAKEIKQRVLGHREEVRIGATLTYATAKINERLKHGQRLREDNFFTHKQEARSDGSEIIEGILLAAQREYQEKKLRFYGNLLASIAFRLDIDRGTANALIRLAEQLSYRQLCILSIGIRRTEFLGRESLYYTYVGQESAQLLSMLSEIITLSQLNLIQLIDISPSGSISGNFTTLSLGELVFNLMELSELDESDIQSVNIALQNWDTTMAKMRIE